MIACKRKKKTQINQNDPVQIGATHWFLPQKNANTKPSKKIKKFFSNTTETIAAIEITYIKSPEHKKKENIAGKN